MFEIYLSINLLSLTIAKDILCTSGSITLVFSMILCMHVNVVNIVYVHMIAKSW